MTELQVSHAGDRGVEPGAQSLNYLVFATSQSPVIPWVHTPSQDLSGGLPLWSFIWRSQRDLCDTQEPRRPLGGEDA